jgi:hypothetical protein
MGKTPNLVGPIERAVFEISYFWGSLHLRTEIDPVSEIWFTSLQDTGQWTEPKGNNSENIVAYGGFKKKH